MNIRHLFYGLAALLLPFMTQAQAGCEYRLELYDAFGDGWNDGFLTVTINDKSEVYPFLDGASMIHPIFVLDGDSLSLSFTPGFFAYEASFSLFDADDVNLFDSGTNPAAGLSFVTRVNCPECPKLPSDGISVDEIRHDRARITWAVNDPNGSYLLTVVPTGTPPENVTPIQLNGTDHYEAGNLEEHSQNDVYVQAICSNGDTSNQIGPFAFETLWARDVGINALVSPISDCDLPEDATISVVLKNYGGSPQSLIPFNYSVNGIPGAVNQPNDGLFTGILSFDSTFTLGFDATFDFSEPISYEVKVWTELDGDKDPSNDTLTSTIVHTPLIYEFPYAIDFEDGPGGWMLDPTSERASLALGEPNALIINQANSGEQAWVTNPDGLYNNRERSALLSPCLNFSLLDKDPELSFALFAATESTFDGAWVEYSLAEGSWTKLGDSQGAGSSWYNTVDDIYGDWWSGENLFGGWRKVRYPLSGLAGESDVRIRIVFQSDEAVIREGIAIDDIFIGPSLSTNMVALDLMVDGGTDCGDEATSVTFNFRNEGSDTFNDISLSYQVNDGPTITESLSVELTPEAEITYTFIAPFNSTQPDEYLITAWTDATGEEFRQNDTTTLTYSTSGPGIPYLENFESGEIPSDWRVGSDLAVENSHNSGSNVLFDNLWEDDTIFWAITPLLGPIEMEDSLFFTYRFVNFSGFGTDPTVLSPGDVFTLEVSEDCGNTYNKVMQIDASNHQTKNTPTLVSMPLDDYVGQWIKLRFKANWGFGDFYFDLDDVNIRRCPNSLEIQASVSPAKGGEDNGSIRLEPAGGISPYRYFWNNGGREASLSGLAPGKYEITVTDQQGCTDFVEVVLETLVDSRELESKIGSLRLFPNPTGGQSLLKIDLKEPADIHLGIYDARGVLLRKTELIRVSQLNYPIDLSVFPDGIYFIRLLAENEVNTLRMIKADSR